MLTSFRFRLLTTSSCSKPVWINSFCKHKSRNL